MKSCCCSLVPTQNKHNPMLRFHIWENKAGFKVTTHTFIRSMGVFTTSGSGSAWLIETTSCLFRPFRFFFWVSFVVSGPSVEAVCLKYCWAKSKMKSSDHLTHLFSWGSVLVLCPAVSDSVAISPAARQETPSSSLQFPAGDHRHTPQSHPHYWWTGCT